MDYSLQRVIKLLGTRRQPNKDSRDKHDILHDSRRNKNIPKDRTVTYARVVVDYRPQKEDPNRVRITVGENLINYPGELTTRMANLVTAKVLWNSVSALTMQNSRASTLKTSIYAPQWRGMNICKYHLI